MYVFVVIEITLEIIPGQPYSDKNQINPIYTYPDLLAKHPETHSQKPYTLSSVSHINSSPPLARVSLVSL